MNAKTVLPERVAAMREVGVTHGRMGVQTFNPEYRDKMCIRDRERIAAQERKAQQEEPAFDPADRFHVVSLSLIHI